MVAKRGNIGVMVRTAVIPAAGFGTRFLPTTKAVPKEMIPLVDKPAIQWVVEEAVRAGIERIVIITGRNKVSIVDHFDSSPDLESNLEATGKTAQLDEIRALASLADIVAVRQGTPKGLGHAVACARSAVGHEPFCVLLPDDIMHPTSPVLADMLAFTVETGRSIVALKRVAGPGISAYGVATIDPDSDPSRPRLTDVVEKPSFEEAASDLAIMGRYVFTPAIFDALDRVRPGALGELQLTDGIRLLARDEAVHGLPFEEGRFDVGNKLDFLLATVELALEHPDLGKPFTEGLIHLVKVKGLL
jgi:UTP--glucose-1-phosphate uridylyltransferase